MAQQSPTRLTQTSPNHRTAKRSKPKPRRFSLTEQAMPSSSISAGKKLDTTPQTKTPITNTLSQIHKDLTVGVVRLALCDRCNSFQWNSVPFNLLSCHLVSSPMPEPFGNPDCNEIAEGKSGMNIPPSGLAVWMCLCGLSPVHHASKHPCVRPIYSAVCLSNTPFNIFTGETL